MTVETMEWPVVGSPRLTALTFNQGWQLDQTGNWDNFTQYDNQGPTFTALDQQRTQNTANEITELANTTGPQWLAPQHDRNGAMTRMPRPADVEEGYLATYDAWNRLVKLETDEETPTLVAEYEYDGLNRRTRKIAGGVTRDYYYSDAWQVLEERGDGTPDRQYVWGIRYIDDLILRDRRTASGLGDERFNALQDANWNVVAIAESLQPILERFAYDPYGKLTQLNPNFTPYTGDEYKWEYTFTGRQLDLESGLYQYRNRYYHAELGRFVSRDPIGYHGEVWNRYEYVLGVPISLLDPLGLEEQGHTLPDTVPQEATTEDKNKPHGIEKAGVPGDFANCAGAACGQNLFITWPGRGDNCTEDDYKKRLTFVPEGCKRVSCLENAQSRNKSVCDCTKCDNNDALELIVWLTYENLPPGVDPRQPMGFTGCDFHMIGRNPCKERNWHSTGRVDRRTKTKMRVVEIMDPDAHFEEVFKNSIGAVIKAGHGKKEKRCFCCEKSKMKFKAIAGAPGYVREFEGKHVDEAMAK